jgi:mannose-6-phosphate isomerase-like protein (cupin superfamily)
MSGAQTRDIRRVVVVDEDDRSRVISDGPPQQVTTDPARPGFRSALLWVTRSGPAAIKGVRESLPQAPPSLRPPPRGSLCRVVDFPPDRGFLDKVSAEEVQRYFVRAGSPDAWTGQGDAPHPYMHKTGSLDFCFVIEGEITLVLDTGQVALKAGDIVVQRGTNHAWSNKSDQPCRVVFTSHHAVFRP